jgi:glycine/D-amino acid oxidase-like deaminating enzyme
MRDWISRFFPHLQTEPLEIHTCLYTNTPDYHFILDRHPNHDNVVIAAGFSGHGFKFGPILGELLAGLVLDEVLPLALDTFALSRFRDSSKIQRRVGA